MYDNYKVSPSYDKTQWFSKIIQPAFGGLDKFYINTYIQWLLNIFELWWNLMIFQNYQACYW